MPRGPVRLCHDSSDEARTGRRHRARLLTGERIGNLRPTGTTMLKLVLLAQEVDVEVKSTGLAWYAYPFWAAVFGSIGYWVYKAYARMNRGKDGGAQIVRPEVDSTPGADPLRPPPAADRLTPPPASPTPPAAPPTRPPTPAASPPVAPTPAAADRDASAPPSGRSGLFAPADPAKPSDQPRLTVAKLLQGIAMPCDLAPIVVTDASASAGLGLEVAFATSGVDASEVGRSVGDELERLGFSVQSVSDTAVEADRDDGRLRVTLVTDPGERKREGRRVYPSLPADSLVVEFESI